MHKIYLTDGKVYSSEDTGWMGLPNHPIEKIEYFLTNKRKLVFKGWERYIILKDMEAVIGSDKGSQVSATILGTYGNESLQITYNFIWKKIGQMINKGKNEYSRMSFNWKKQTWITAPSQPINPTMWHVGQTTDEKPSVKLSKV